MNFIAVFKNIAYSFSANLISLGISIFMVLVVPKFLSVDDYGLWQLFLFYFSYLGFLHFGWEDGIYLRYAGKSLDELNRRTFAGQFYGIVALQIFEVVTVIGFGKLAVMDPVKQMALVCAVCLAPFVNFNNLCNFILQITNCIKEYVSLLLAERMIFFFSVVFFLLVWQQNEFRYMYCANLFSVVGGTLIGVYFFRNFLKPRFDPFAQIVSEIKENISVGIKLMFANVAGMLIVGIIRYGISMGWDVATFGKVSLTLNLSNFLLVFINSVSVVFFPIIKRMDEERRADVYREIRDVLTFLLFGALLGYYPLKCILSWWLPKYADSLIYMSILFPVCVFESKVCLLINTYLKSMRQEVLMLKINIGSVLMSLAVTGLAVGLFQDLNLTVFSIVGVYAFRCIVAEYVTGKLLGLSLGKEILTDVVMCGVFIATGWLFDDWRCMAFYGMVYGMLLFLEKNRFCKMLARWRQVS